jgi:hypothetical protein
MTMTLPPDLVTALGMLGFDWPDSDEDKLEGMGHVWRGFASTLNGLIDEVDKQAQIVYTTNDGYAITTFKEAWLAQDAPVASLREGVLAATLIGDGCIAAAAIVVALKLSVIAEVAFFARTLYLAGIAAKTPWSAAAAIAAIIAARMIAQAAIEEAFRLAVEALERG